MQNSDVEVYVMIGLDKKGNVVEVRRRGGDPIAPRLSKPGELRIGDNVPGCDEIAKRLVHELLTCRKKAAMADAESQSESGTGASGGSGSGSGGSGSGSGSGGESGSGSEAGTDPCCYRDPFTGRIWCWC